MHPLLSTVRNAKRMEETFSGKTKVTEEDIASSLQQTCEPLTTSGEWIARTDLVEDGSKLTLVEQVGTVLSSFLDV